MTPQAIFKFSPSAGRNELLVLVYDSPPSPPDHGVRSGRHPIL